MVSQAILGCLVALKNMTQRAREHTLIGARVWASFSMCGACASEPQASYREGDVVLVKSPTHGVKDERVAKIRESHREWGLQVQFLSGSIAWLEWTVFCPLTAPDFSMKRVSDMLFDDCAVPSAMPITVGHGWLKKPFVMPFAPAAARNAPPGARTRKRSLADRAGISAPVEVD